MDGYGSITIANHGLFRLIRFSRELALICQKKFINKLYLILLNSKTLFDVIGIKLLKSLETNRPLEQKVKS